MGIRFTGGRKAYLQAGLAGALGTVEVRPIDLTSAYGSIANGGVHVPPRMILEIRGPDGTVVWQAPSPEGSKAISPQAAFLVTDVLAGNTDKAQNPIWAAKVALYNGKGGARRPAAVKTGTSNDARDLATYGFLPPHGGWPAVDSRSASGWATATIPTRDARKPATSLTAAAPAVARLHARVHERLAGDPVRATEGRGQGDHRRLVGRQAGSVDEGDDQGMVHRRHAARRPQGRRPGRPAVQPVVRRLPRRSPQGGARSERPGIRTSPTGCDGRVGARA